MSRTLYTVDLGHLLHRTEDPHEAEDYSRAGYAVTAVTEASA